MTTNTFRLSFGIVFITLFSRWIYEWMKWRNAFTSIFPNGGRRPTIFPAKVCKPFSSDPSYLGHVMHANRAHGEMILSPFSIYSISLTGCACTNRSNFLFKTTKQTTMWNVPNIQIVPVKYYSFPHLVLLLCSWCGNVEFFFFILVSVFPFFFCISFFGKYIIWIWRRGKFMVNFR